MSLLYLNEREIQIVVFIGGIVLLQITNYPVFFNRNRVWRVYKGGLLYSDFLGDEKKDSNYPEEWVASTVKAINKNSTDPLEGLSVIEGMETTLKEVIEKYPYEMLGNKKSFNLLVKYLDSAIRLPLQAHPDKEFSEKYFNSSFGKTEMWLILATRENASICFGFKEKITEEEFSEVIEKSKTDKHIMDNYLNQVPVKPGEVYLIPAKAVHAIGYGCLILEVQEPTDFTIQPEYWCGDYLLDDKEMYMGLPKEVALKCFDYSLYGEESIHKSKKEPVLAEENSEFKKEILISYEDTPCFAVNRYLIKQQMPLNGTPAVYIVTKGEGTILGQDYRKDISKGDYFFLPVNAGNMFNIKTKGDVEIVECLPPSEGL